MNNYVVFDTYKNEVLYLGRKEQVLEYQKWLFHKAKMLGDMDIFFNAKIMRSDSLKPVTEKEVSYHELVDYMKQLGIALLNEHSELIIHEETNTYTYIGECNSMEDIETCVVYSLCRPISKGLEDKYANLLLEKVNNYYNKKLTKEDFLLMYKELCYVHKFNELKSFIQRGFPMEELKNEN